MASLKSLQHRYTHKPQYMIYDFLMTVISPIRLLLKFVLYPITAIIIPASREYAQKQNDEMKTQSAFIQSLKGGSEEDNIENDLYSSALIPNDFFSAKESERRLVFVTFGNAASVADQKAVLSHLHNNLSKKDGDNAYAVIGVDPMGVNDGRYVFSHEQMVDGMYDFIQKRINQLGMNENANHVAFVGQSLGGALLTSVAAKFHRHDFCVKCLTVASPRNLSVAAESVLGIMTWPRPIRWLVSSILRPITTAILSLSFGLLNTHHAAADFKNKDDLQVVTVTGSSQHERRDGMIHELASMKSVVDKENHHQLHLINPTSDDPCLDAHQFPWVAVPETIDTMILNMFENNKESINKYYDQAQAYSIEGNSSDEARNILNKAESDHMARVNNYLRLLQEDSSDDDSDDKTPLIKKNQ